MTTFLEKFQKFNQNYDLIQIQMEESLYKLDDLPTTDSIDDPNDIENIILMSNFDNFQSEPSDDPKYSIYEKNKNTPIKENLTLYNLQVFINNLK